MAAAPASEGLGDPEPFSPSIFLNLSPEPDGSDGPGPAPAPAPKDDDLVLPFIWRMLMEEDVDDSFFYEHPDHSALLQAQQQTFAEILSGASSSSTSATTTRSSGSSPLAACCILSPLSSSSSSDAPAFADATWPYDPAQLSQQLLSTAHHGIHSFGGGGGATANAAENSTMMTMPPAPAAAAGDGRNRVISMDMLNLAFLKGLQEANSFLPVTTNGDWGDDGLEAEEQGRSSKLMAVEPEEAGEEAHEIVQDVYQALVHAMQSMNITTSRDAEKKSRKGNATEAVDLRTLLIHCAQTIATGGDRLAATQLLRTIKQRSSPTGDATQRLAHCFTRGLEARLQGTAMPAAAKSASAADLLKAYRQYMEVCCFESMAFKFSNMAICKALLATGTGRNNNKKKVHVLDYGYSYGFQWPGLLSFWSRQQGGPPEVRITVVDLPQPGFRPAARIDAAGRCLSDFARRLGVPFRFRGIAARWETVQAKDLDIDPDEVLIVNGLLRLENLKDEGVDIDNPSPRDMVVRNIRHMRPDAFILCVENSSYNAPFFATRFREALFYFSALFDMMDATAPRDSAERVLVEQEIFGRRAMNIIACEGPERVERPEAYKQWQVRCSRAGLRQTPLDSEIVSAVRKKVKDKYHRDFFVDVDEEWLLQGWKGRALCAISTWVANDDAV